MSHWTDVEIDKFEKAMTFSVRGIESWLRHLLTDEKKRLEYCRQHIETSIEQRMNKDCESLRKRYSQQKSQEGELKANIRGIEYVLDAWPKFVEKAFNGYCVNQRQQEGRNDLEGNSG